MVTVGPGLHHRVMSQTQSTRTYPPGVPCWVEVEPLDPNAAKDFYGGLFGWTFANAMPPDAPDYYLIAQLEGQDVAGIGMPPDEFGPYWHTYIVVDDADVAAAAVEVAGGGVLTPPPPEPGPGGRAAAVADPQGAAFRLWQPGRRLGAQVVNAPNAWNFSNLHTPDPSAARPFYAEVFGWEFDGSDVGSGDVGLMVRQPGYGDHLAATADPEIRRRQAAVGAPPAFADAIAWIVPVHAELPYWEVTFRVADRDEALASVERLGGQVVSVPPDTAWSRTARVGDPDGAVFSISQFTPPGG